MNYECIVYSILCILGFYVKFIFRVKNKENI